MSVAEVVQYTLLIGIAVVLLLAMVLGMALTAHAGRHYQKSLFPWVFVAMSLGMIWSPIASRRDLSSGAAEFLATAGEYGSALWLSRLLTLVVVFIAASRIIGWLFAENRRRHPGVGLYVALLMVLVTHNFIAAALGTKPVFIHNSIYPLLLFTAAFFSVQYEYERSLLFARNTLLIYLLVGALAAFIQPGIAIQKGYTVGLLPGIDFRYWGLGSHANTLGPLALLFILLALHQPFASRMLQWFVIGFAVASLFLTQSKTAWGGGLLAITSLVLARYWPRLVQEWRSGQANWGMASLMVGAFLAILAFTAVLLNPDTGRGLRGFTASSTGAGLLSLTGRVDIWALALEDWSRNPLFGYGPSWGDLEYRFSVGLTSAVHAHNQFIQSMAMAGTVGLLATVFYILLLARYAIRGFHASRGLTAGLLAMVLVRTITETPLTINNWGGAEVFIQLLTFTVMLAYGSPRAGARAPATTLSPANRSGTPAPR
jgi:O-antigen ligase